jgi:hypothetical protein
VSRTSKNTIEIAFTDSCVFAIEDENAWLLSAPPKCPKDIQDFIFSTQFLYEMKEVAKELKIVTKPTTYITYKIQLKYFELHKVLNGELLTLFTPKIESPYEDYVSYVTDILPTMIGLNYYTCLYKDYDGSDDLSFIKKYINYKMVDFDPVPEIFPRVIKILDGLLGVGGGPMRLTNKRVHMRNGTFKRVYANIRGDVAIKMNKVFRFFKIK